MSLIDKKISQNPSIMQNKVNLNMFKIIQELTEVGFFDFMFQNKEDKESFLESLDLEWLEENIQYLDYPDKFNEYFLQIFFVKQNGGILKC